MAAAASIGAKPRVRRVSAQDRKAVAYRQRYACAACQCVLPPDHEVDHVVPVALNGSDALSNLQALCKPCHAQKTRDQRTLIKGPHVAVSLEGPVKAEKKPAERLNAQQLACVDHVGGPIRVVAGPGTGKTRVLTRRVAELVKRGADPS